MNRAERTRTAQALRAAASKLQAADASVDGLSANLSSFMDNLDTCLEDATALGLKDVVDYLKKAKTQGLRAVGATEAAKKSV